MNNFTPAQPSECLIFAIDEMDNVFADFGIELDFGRAIDNEILATDVVEGILNKINGDGWL